MSNQDKELFELCKEVYKRFPEWEDAYLNAIDKKGQIWDKDAAWTYSDHYVPLYTSDYLLEKLPHRIPNRPVHFVGRYLEVCPVTPNSVKGWRATYINEPFTQYADTPLKALLKLTLALNDAGVKLTKEEGES